jgi:sulfur-oxidizing protein SoxY
MLLPLLPLPADESSPLPELIREVAGDAPIQDSGMALELPKVADNGNSVALSVFVDSPMTAADYVKSIHLFAPENPRPVIARYFLNPHSGRAEIHTRIRLAATQRVSALAELSDGSFRRAYAKVIVAVAACVDGS